MTITLILLALAIMATGSLLRAFYTRKARKQAADRHERIAKLREKNGGKP